MPCGRLLRRQHACRGGRRRLVASRLRVVGARTWARLGRVDGVFRPPLEYPARLRRGAARKISFARRARRKNRRLGDDRTGGRIGFARHPLRRAQRRRRLDFERRQTLHLARRHRRFFRRLRRQRRDGNSARAQKNIDRVFGRPRNAGVFGFARLRIGFAPRLSKRRVGFFRLQIARRASFGRAGSRLRHRQRMAVFDPPRRRRRLRWAGAAGFRARARARRATQTIRAKHRPLSSRRQQNRRYGDGHRRRRFFDSVRRLAARSRPARQPRNRAGEIIRRRNARARDRRIVADFRRHGADARFAVGAVLARRARRAHLGRTSEIQRHIIARDLLRPLEE